MSTSRSTINGIGNNSSRSTKLSTSRSTRENDSLPNSKFSTGKSNFSNELKSGISVVIPKQEYDRIRRTVEIQSPPTDLPITNPAPVNPNNEITKSNLQKKAEKCVSDRSSHRPSEDDVDQKQAMEIRKKFEKFRDEQEVEIRRLNEMITEAKCLATREEQIIEKKRQADSAKLNEMETDQTLEERQKELDQKKNEFRSKQKIINQRYAEMIRQQIDANEVLRKNAERTMRDWEAKKMEERMNRFRQDQTQERIKKLEKQRELREGLEECIAERNRLAEQRKTEEAIIRKKMEAYAADRAAWKKSVQDANDRRMAAVQQRLSGLHFDDAIDVETTAMKTRRIREELDRSWRLNELKLQAERLDDRHRLTKAREEQIRFKERRAADEATKQREQHQNLLELERKETEAFKEFELKRRQRALAYGNDVLQQIKEKQERFRLEKEDSHLEVARIKKANEEHGEKILEIKATKLQELKSQEVPSKYVMDIARKSRIPWNIIQ